MLRGFFTQFISVLPLAIYLKYMLKSFKLESKTLSVKSLINLPVEMSLFAEIQTM